MLTTEITENTEEKVSVGSVPSVVLSTNKVRKICHDRFTDSGEGDDRRGPHPEPGDRSGRTRVGKPLDQRSQAGPLEGSDRSYLRGDRRRVRAAAAAQPVSV